MHVEIYSLQRILFEGDAQSLNCKTQRGEITVLPKHEPLISVLEEGPVKVMIGGREGAGQEEVYAVKGGFLEVNARHAVRLLVEE